MAKLTKVDPYGKAAFPTIEVPDRVADALFVRGIEISDFEHKDGAWDVEIRAHFDGEGDIGHVLHVPDDEMHVRGAWGRAIERLVAECRRRGHTRHQYLLMNVMDAIRD